MINQKAKLIEVSNQYAVYDANGQQIAAVQEARQGPFRKVIRVLFNFDQLLRHQLDIVDANATVLMRVVKPGAFIKAAIRVEGPNGELYGTITNKIRLGKARFVLADANGTAVGEIRAENWRAWDFAIIDPNETEWARIKKTWEGLTKAVFTTADNYVVQIHPQTPQPLRTIAIGSALAVDLMLKQAKG